MRSPRKRRRGAIIVAASWILLILVAATIITANRMRVEMLASANIVARAQADAVELGAEQFVLEQIAANYGDAGTLINIDPNTMQAVQIGDGYFWIVRPNPDDPNSYDFGITDESSKLNINQATSAMLMLLPNMTQDIADSIVSWRSATAVSTSGTAGSEIYYMTLPDPYHSKGAPFESVEELLMVKDVTRDLLYGEDTNHNGVLEALEQTGTNPGAPDVTLNLNNDDGRGWYNVLTAHSAVPTTTTTTAATSTTGTTTTIINVNQNVQALNTVLSSKLGSARANAIMQRVGPQGGGGARGGRGGGGGATTPQTFTNVFDFYSRSGMTSAEFAQIVDQITTGRVATAVINVNTASATVLQCLPGITLADATTMISMRDGYVSPSNTNSTVPVGSFGWVLNAISGPKAQAIGAYITATSYQFSADIVGVSGDGRAFKRVRIIVDNSQTPAKIVYRKNLTDLGWPLDPDIRTQLRSGQGISTGPLGMKGGL